MQMDVRMKTGYPRFVWKAILYPQKWNIAIPKRHSRRNMSPVNITVDADVPSYELPLHLGMIETGKIPVEFGSYVFDNAHFRTNGFAIMQD